MIENISNVNQIWYYNATSGQYICELNEFNLLNKIEKYPKIVFWLSVAILGAVLLNKFIMPLLREKKIYKYIFRVPDTIIYFSAPALVWFAAFTTFNITEEISKNYIELPLIIFLVIALAYTIWKKRHIIKQKLNEEKKE